MTPEDQKLLEKIRRENPGLLEELKKMHFEEFKMAGGASILKARQKVKKLAGLG
jgi:hypothetical protein